MSVLNHQERFQAIMHYQEYDRLPVLHFGYWSETVEKWRNEGHIKIEEAVEVGDGSPSEQVLSSRLGFDYNYFTCFHTIDDLFPCFESKILEIMPDGTRKVLNCAGVTIIQKNDAGSIPAEFDHMLKDRRSWEEHFRHRLQYCEERIDTASLESLKTIQRDTPLGLHCGSLIGNMRGWLGVPGLSYLVVDDEELYDEIIATVGELCYRLAERVLRSGVSFDFGHFWEDICYKNGPLVSPQVFSSKVGPQYKRISGLLNRYGIDIVSVDCDGSVDALIPGWLDNGVNAMFPIEVGTWCGSIGPMRQRFGKQLRGIGGMNKHVFSRDYTAVDTEIERMKPLVELGGYIPCPDHRIAPDAKWEVVQYYCERMRRTFG